MRSYDIDTRRWTPALVAALLVAPTFLVACGDDDDPTGPNLPTGVTVTVTAIDDMVRLSWTAGADVTSYRAQLVGTNTLERAVGPSLREATFTADEGLMDGVSYTASVITVTASGEVPSANSPTVVPDFFPWDEYFPTSLHETGAGKQSFYNQSPNSGFERFTLVSYSELACQGCHSQSSGLGPVAGRGCERCHDTANPQLGAQVDASLSGACGACHGRQKAEAIVHGYSDVHRDAGMGCMDCHTLEDVMGDGTQYASMLEDGAIDADCGDCHSQGASHDVHNGKLDCGTCHIQSVVSCYNCHFETEVMGAGKVAYGQFKDWLFLINNAEGQVTTANIQALKWGGTAEVPEKYTFIAMAPYYAHTITRNARTCSDCHDNTSVQDYADDGVIDVVTWSASMNRLTRKTGVIPVPPDFLTALRFDFVDQPAPAIGGPGGPWTFFETGPDTLQILYGTPLTTAQMSSLGF